MLNSWDVQWHGGHSKIDLSTRYGTRSGWRVCTVTVLWFLTGCQLSEGHRLQSVMHPSNDRDWRPDAVVLATAEIDRDEVTIRNIRNCSYASKDVFVVAHYDKKFNLESISSVDFIVVPFRNSSNLAHTMLSFGTDDGQHIAVSVEARLEKGESYSAVLGALRQFELMYVVGDERDLIHLRAKHRNDDVYIYPIRASRHQAQALFTDVMQRVNQLERKPEFYDTFMNNCTSSIIGHVNQLVPGKVPFDIRNFLPGLSDRIAYDLGLLEDAGSFEETRRRALVSLGGQPVHTAEDYSDYIRR